MLRGICTFIVAVTVIAAGIVLKRYTASKLKDIDGISPVIQQGTGNNNIIDQF